MSSSEESYWEDQPFYFNEKGLHVELPSLKTTKAKQRGSAKDANYLKTSEHHTNNGDIISIEKTTSNPNRHVTISPHVVDMEGVSSHENTNASAMDILQRTADYTRPQRGILSPKRMQCKEANIKPMESTNTHAIEGNDKAIRVHISKSTGTGGKRGSQSNQISTPKSRKTNANALNIGDKELIENSNTSALGDGSYATKSSGKSVLQAGCARKLVSQHSKQMSYYKNIAKVRYMLMRIAHAVFNLVFNIKSSNMQIFKDEKVSKAVRRAAGKGLRALESEVDFLMYLRSEKLAPTLITAGLTNKQSEKYNVYRDILKRYADLMVLTKECLCESASGINLCDSSFDPRCLGDVTMSPRELLCYIDEAHRLYSQTVGDENSKYTSLRAQSDTSVEPTRNYSKMKRSGRSDPRSATQDIYFSKNVPIISGEATSDGVHYTAQILGESDLQSYTGISVSKGFTLSSQQDDTTPFAFGARDEWFHTPEGFVFDNNMTPSENKHVCWLYGRRDGDGVTRKSGEIPHDRDCSMQYVSTRAEDIYTYVTMTGWKSDEQASEQDINKLVRVARGGIESDNESLLYEARMEAETNLRQVLASASADFQDKSESRSVHTQTDRERNKTVDNQNNKTFFMPKIDMLINDPDVQSIKPQTMSPSVSVASLESGIGKSQAVVQPEPISTRPSGVKSSLSPTKLPSEVPVFRPSHEPSIIATQRPPKQLPSIVKIPTDTEKLPTVIPSTVKPQVVSSSNIPHKSSSTKQHEVNAFSSVSIKHNMSSPVIQPLFPLPSLIPATPDGSIMQANGKISTTVASAPSKIGQKTSSAMQPQPISEPPNIFPSSIRQLTSEAKISTTVGSIPSKIEQKPSSSIKPEPISEQLASEAKISAPLSSAKAMASSPSIKPEPDFKLPNSKSQITTHKSNLSMTSQASRTGKETSVSEVRDGDEVIVSVPVSSYILRGPNRQSIDSRVTFAMSVDNATELVSTMAKSIKKKSTEAIDEPPTEMDTQTLKSECADSDMDSIIKRVLQDHGGDISSKHRHGKNDAPTLVKADVMTTLHGGSPDKRYSWMEDIPYPDDMRSDVSGKEITGRSASDIARWIRSTNPDFKIPSNERLNEPYMEDEDDGNKSFSQIFLEAESFLNSTHRQSSHVSDIRSIRPEMVDDTDSADNKNILESRLSHKKEHFGARPVSLATFVDSALSSIDTSHVSRIDSNLIQDNKNILESKLSDKKELFGARPVSLATFGSVLSDIDIDGYHESHVSRIDSTLTQARATTPVDILLSEHDPLVEQSITSRDFTHAGVAPYESEEELSSVSHHRHLTDAHRVKSVDMRANVENRDENLTKVDLTQALDITLSKSMATEISSQQLLTRQRSTDMVDLRHRVGIRNENLTQHDLSRVDTISSLDYDADELVQSHIISPTVLRNPRIATPPAVTSPRRSSLVSVSSHTGSRRSSVRFSDHQLERSDVTPGKSPETVPVAGTSKITESEISTASENVLSGSSTSRRRRRQKRSVSNSLKLHRSLSKIHKKWGSYSNSTSDVKLSKSSKTVTPISSKSVAPSKSYISNMTSQGESAVEMIGDTGAQEGKVLDNWRTDNINYCPESALFQQRLVEPIRPVDNRQITNLPSVNIIPTYPATQDIHTETSPQMRYNEDMPDMILHERVPERLKPILEGRPYETQLTNTAYSRHDCDTQTQPTDFIQTPNYADQGNYPVVDGRPNDSDVPTSINFQTGTCKYTCHVDARTTGTSGRDFPHSIFCPVNSLAPPPFACMQRTTPPNIEHIHEHHDSVAYSTGNYPVAGLISDDSIQHNLIGETPYSFDARYNIPNVDAGGVYYNNHRHYRETEVDYRDSPVQPLYQQDNAPIYNQGTRSSLQRNAEVVHEHENNYLHAMNHTTFGPQYPNINSGSANNREHRFINKSPLFGINNKPDLSVTGLNSYDSVLQPQLGRAFASNQHTQQPNFITRNDSTVGDLYLQGFNAVANESRATFGRDISSCSVRNDSHLHTASRVQGSFSPNFMTNNDQFVRMATFNNQQSRTDQSNEFRAFNVPSHNRMHLFDPYHGENNLFSLGNNEVYLRENFQPLRYNQMGFQQLRTSPNISTHRSQFPLFSPDEFNNSATRNVSSNNERDVTTGPAVCSNRSQVIENANRLLNLVRTQRQHSSNLDKRNATTNREEQNDNHNIQSNRKSQQNDHGKRYYVEIRDNVDKDKVRRESTIYRPVTANPTQSMEERCHVSDMRSGVPFEHDALCNQSQSIMNHPSYNSNLDVTAENGTNQVICLESSVRKIMDLQKRRQILLENIKQFNRERETYLRSVRHHRECIGRHDARRCASNTRPYPNQISADPYITEQETPTHRSENMTNNRPSTCSLPDNNAVAIPYDGIESMTKSRRKSRSSTVRTFDDDVFVTPQPPPSKREVHPKLLLLQWRNIKGNEPKQRTTLCQDQDNSRSYSHWDAVSSTENKSARTAPTHCDNERVGYNGIISSPRDRRSVRGGNVSANWLNSPTECTHGQQTPGQSHSPDISNNYNSYNFGERQLKSILKNNNVAERDAACRRHRTTRTRSSRQASSVERDSDLSTANISPSKRHKHHPRNKNQHNNVVLKIRPANVCLSATNLVVSDTMKQNNTALCPASVTEVALNLDRGDGVLSTEETPEDLEVQKICSSGTNAHGDSTIDKREFDREGLISRSQFDRSRGARVDSRSSNPNGRFSCSLGNMIESLHQSDPINILFRDGDVMSPAGVLAVLSTFEDGYFVPIAPASPQPLHHASSNPNF